MKIKYLNHEEFDLNPKDFLAYTNKLNKQIKATDKTINVVFVNDTYIQSLNKAYRDKDKATDVLSFNYEGENSDFDLKGEIYISVETAKRQAKEHKHQLEDELIKLITHGLLHVHGYDHEEEEDYKKMYAVEKAVLGKIAGPYIKKEE